MTRTLKISVLVMVGAMVLWACGGSNLGPKETGEKFLKAMAEGDYDTAKKYASEESEGEIETLAQMSGGEKTGSADDIVVGEVKEDGDKATLSYTEKGAEKTLNLIKEDGEWKAVFSKMGGDTGGANPLGDIMEGVEDAVENVADELGEAMEEAAE